MRTELRSTNNYIHKLYVHTHTHTYICRCVFMCAGMCDSFADASIQDKNDLQPKRWQQNVSAYVK